MTTTLPSFRNPPVTEVVASVTFKPIQQLNAVALGRLWDRYLSGEFPRVEEQPPYDPPMERFGPPTPAGLSLQLEAGFPSPRMWFLNEDGNELLQFQRNWFACNWRKVRPDDQYARWPSRRTAFSTWYEALSKFLGEEGLDVPVPVQCEVTYINHIVAGDTWKSHGELHRILRIVAPPAEFDLVEEQRSMTAQFLMAKDGEPWGRLHVKAQPAFRREDDRPVVVLELTARGIPQGTSLPGILTFLDAGRDAIVTGFAAITAPEMHTEWGRYE